MLIALPSARGETTTLRIMETTDIHMNLFGYDYYKSSVTNEHGLSNTYKLISEARKETPNNLLIDNGDLLQGSPLGDQAANYFKYAQGESNNHLKHPAYLLMNQMGYAVGNLGNHDFNYGLDYLQSMIKQANFPYINANVIDAKNKKPLFNPYVILDKSITMPDGSHKELKVGVIGFAPPQIMEWDKVYLEGKVKVLDIIDTAKYYVPKIKAAGADIIIAVPHSGIEPQYSDKSLSENVVLDLSKIRGIDAILFGHAHALFPSPQFANYPGVNLESGTINGIPAVMAGWWGNSLGVIDLVLDNSNKQWKITSAKASLMQLKDYPSLMLSPQKLESNELNKWQQMTIDYLNESIGYSKQPIYSYFSLVTPSSPNAIIHLAQLEYAKEALAKTKYAQLPLLSAVAPFKSGGRQGNNYYTAIESGPILRKDIADLYVYPNTIAIVKVSGSELREWLEMAAGQFNNLTLNFDKPEALLNDNYPRFNFDDIAGEGFSYIINLQQPARYSVNGKLVNQNSHRIEQLSYQGKPLNLKQEFLVVTNNYRYYVSLAQFSTIYTGNKKSTT